MYTLLFILINLLLSASGAVLFNSLSQQMSISDMMEQLKTTDSGTLMDLGITAGLIFLFVLSIYLIIRVMFVISRNNKLQLNQIITDKKQQTVVIKKEILTQSSPAAAPAPAAPAKKKSKQVLKDEEEQRKKAEEENLEMHRLINSQNINTDL